MAKQIKAIQCPKCGSTDKTEVKPDYFRCNNCNTEYFLDNDDVTINHNVNYSQPQYAPPVPTVGKQKQVIFIALGIAVMFLIFVLPRILSSRNSSGVLSNSISSPGSKIDWSRGNSEVYASASGKPILVIVGERSYGTKEDVPSVGFIDLVKEKELKVTELGAKLPVASSDYNILQFGNGDIYVTVNKMKVYKINKSDYSIQDVTATLFAQHTEMSSGIANVEFMYKSDGEGFKVINNEGRNYFYYPMVDKLMTKDQKYAAEDELERKVAGEKLVTAFKFTRSSTFYPEKGIQLMQYTKKDAAGGADDWPTFEWNDSYRSGSKQMSVIQFGQNLLRSYKDFTPERRYFNPDLKYFDKNVVIFTMANTPAENAPKSLQCLDANTGAILWTMPVAERNIKLIRPYPEGFMATTYGSGILITKQGKIISEYKF